MRVRFFPDHRQQARKAGCEPRRKAGRGFAGRTRFCGRSPARLLPLAAFCLLFAACGLFTARADIQQPPRAHAKGERQLQRRTAAPATATAQSVQVEAGNNARITLAGEGPDGKTLNFFIRTPPRHGTISGDPVSQGRNHAVVFYVPAPGNEAEDDEFTFSVQSPGGGMSAPEAVRLRLLPLAASLVASPAELDFGAVKAGETASALFTLENRGGSLAVGRVEPPVPFEVDGAADYRLARGAQQTFRLVFRPTGEEVFNAGLHFQFEAGGGVRLVGTGLADPSRPAVASGASVPGGGVPTGRGSGAASVYPAAEAPPAATNPPLAALTAAATPRAVAAAPVGPRFERGAGGPGQTSVEAVPDRTYMPVNEAAVRQVQVLDVGRSTVDLAWKPPVPRPASYRVELRYIVVDDDVARAEWRPYAQVDVDAGRDLIKTRVRRLPAGGLQMLRIVAVDRAGQLAAPSPMITVMMGQPSTWWRPTVLKGLLLLLAVFGFLLFKRRREERQMLAEIDESRARASAQDGSPVWRS